MKRLTATLLWLCLLLPAVLVAAPKRDLDVERIEAQLGQFLENREASARVSSEIARVREAVRALAATPQRKKELRQRLAYITERRLDIAVATAEWLALKEQVVELDREHDQILLEASRRDAELSRLEAEKLRVQSLARAEEIERVRRDANAARAESAENAQAAESARDEAEQARRLARAQATEADLARREADLAMAAADSLRAQMQSLKARQDSRGMVMTLGESVFAPGQSSLREDALQNLDAVLTFVNQDRTRLIRVEGHTDTQGSANLNQVLSQQRADAVQAALIARGVEAARISAVGLGPAVPVASNDSAAGRARNRRVEVILLEPK